MNNKQSESLERARANLRGKLNSFKDVVDSPNGKIMMKDLKEKFDPPVLCKASIESSALRAAQRDVIRYIEDMAKGVEKNEI